jgi:hypothetical protein
MERLMRWREPAMVVVLVALGLHLVVVLLSAGLGSADLGPLAPDLAYALADPVLLLLLTALVVACWVAPAAPHARRLTIAALVVTVVTLVGVVAFAVLALVLAPPALWSSYVPWALTAPAVGVVALGALIALLRRPLSAAAPVPELEPAEPEPEPVDPQQQPTWTSDTAVGTVWRRAGDAGSERPATSWDAPAAGGGSWGSDPDADGPAQATRRTTD